MVFYYDETFHDKKITQNKNGVLNGYSKNSNDSFIYALVGFDEASNLIEKYNELESRIKLSLQLDKELKSTIFDKDNFEYGLKSMRRQCKDFYNEFLNLLIDSNFVFQVGIDIIKLLKSYVNKEQLNIEFSDSDIKLLKE